MPTAALAKPPTSELGITSPATLPSWGALSYPAHTGIFVDDHEDVDALRWPTSVRETLPRLRNDSQLKALMSGTILPVTSWAWGIDPNGANPGLVDDICREFGLLHIDDALTVLETGESPVPLGRTRNRFSFAKHQAEALKALELGHAFFEQVGEIGPDGLWHLRKLAPRPQRSIIQIRVAQDGGLVSIKQQVGLDSPEIPVGRLVAYAWDSEPGSWIGRSMYRACYREWLIKDRLLRVDAANHENLGGAIILEGAKDMRPAQIAELAGMATQMRAGIGGGGAVPNGVTPHPVRAGGGGPTTIDSINRHDQAMTRPFFLMVVQLGSTQTGSRALGGTFAELMGIFQEGVAVWFRDVFNEHVIEDYVDWNYGPDVDLVPRLAFRRPKTAPSPDAGVQQVADQSPGVAAALDTIRREIEGSSTGRRSSASGRTANGHGGHSRSPLPLADARAALPLPQRTLRRGVYDHEVRAQADFQEIDRNWQSSVDQLVLDWTTVRASQIAELEAKIALARGDVIALAQLAATPDGAVQVAARLKTMAALGAAEAVAEAARQGVTVTAPELAALDKELDARASALEQLLARSLSQAAANKAVQLSGGALVPLEVAAEVRNHLAGLSDSYLQDQFGGAVSAAQNAGRLATFAATSQPRSLYASELLDVNTCAACAEVDGREYGSTEEAAKDYPAGGYHLCQGGPRCRGTVVAVFTEADSTQAAAAAAAAAAPDEPERAPAWFTTEVAGLRAQIDELRAAAERRSEPPQPLTVNLHQAAAEPARVEFHEGAIAPVTTIEDGAIRATVEPAHVDVHVPAPPRPRSAHARRRDDGSLDVTYSDGDER